MKTRNKWRINRYEFLVIFFSGLIRGPVAYALIQNEQIINTDASKISEFVTESTAIFIVVITTILIGGVLKYFLEWTFKAIETNPRYHQDHPSMKETFIRQSLSLVNTLLYFEGRNRLEIVQEVHFEDGAVLPPFR
jgi:sodium/hydrogen exchanger-like protein 6/7/sodium/hydrogen exchanger 8